jgi:hypothetical protein
VKLVEEPYHKSANALLIHHFVVPLPRWGRLNTPTNQNLKHSLNITIAIHVIDLEQKQ